MKDIIQNKLNTIFGMEEKYNLLREYLQCLILKIIEEKGYIKNIAFVGGTALKFLYGLGRFSEDLDFSLVNKTNFTFPKFQNDLARSLDTWNIKTEIKAKTTKTVISYFIKFPEILYEVGLTQRKEQKILIKLEIDTNPPTGFSTEFTFNGKYLPMNIFHYDLPSLFTGKLHAILLRKYTKARDFYDLMWFLGKKIQPNFFQLENAIYQTTGKKTKIDKESLRLQLKSRLSDVDFLKLRKELSPFLVNGDEAKYLTLKNFEQLIEEFMGYS